MKQRTRIYYSDSQKALMWERWKKGESLQQIAQLFDRNHSSVSRILAETGGIRPAQHCRSRLALSLTEREEISRSLVAGQSIRAIALQLGRAPSSVSREIKRNGGQGSYRATQADQAAWDRSHRPKRCKLVQNRTLARVVTGKPMSMGTTANCRMAQAYLPVRRGLPRVTRNHLPQSVHSSPWRIEEGTTATFETHQGHAPFAPPHPEDRQPRQDHQHRIYQ